MGCSSLSLRCTVQRGCEDREKSTRATKLREGFLEEVAFLEGQAEMRVDAESKGQAE